MQAASDGRGGQVTPLKYSLSVFRFLVFPDETRQLLKNRGSVGSVIYEAGAGGSKSVIKNLKLCKNVFVNPRIGSKSVKCGTNYII